MAFILLSAIWGSSFLFLRIAIQDFGPFLLSELRVSFAFLSLLPFLYLFKKSRVRTGNKLRIFFFLGSINSAVPFVCFSVAAVNLPSGYLAVMNSFVPVWSLFFSFILLDKKIELKSFLGLIIGILGVMIFVGFGPVTLNKNSIIAIFFAFLATLCYAISGVLTKKYCPDEPVLNISVYCLGFSSIILLPAIILDVPKISPSNQAWIAVISLGVLCSGVALLLYFKLLKVVGPIKTTTVTFVVPVFATLWGTVFVNEKFTLAMGVGLILILISSLMVFFQK